MSLKLLPQKVGKSVPSYSDFGLKLPNRTLNEFHFQDALRSPRGPGFTPPPPLPLPLRGREIIRFLPFQGGC
jgi:hypothetical protein